MKRAMIAAALAIVALANVAASYEDRATAKAVKSACEDTFFCAEGWEYKRAGSDGGYYYFCGETETWIWCNSGNTCWCYHSETCPCPPVGNLISDKARLELDELIKEYKESRKGKP